MFVRVCVCVCERERETERERQREREREEKREASYLSSPGGSCLGPFAVPSSFFSSGCLMSTGSFKKYFSDSLQHSSDNVFGLLLFINA